MALDNSICTDDTLLSRSDRALFKLESVFNLTAGLVIFAMMLLAVAQIFGRKLFNMPVPGFIDWVEQAMAVFAFLGISYCQRLGGHIRMDILVSNLKGRTLWLAEFVSTICMILLTSALTYGSWLHFKRAYDLGDSSIDLNLPIWPAKLLIPLALGMLTIRLALQAWGYARALKTGAVLPVAVPLIEDAATQAAREAEAVSEAVLEGDKA